MSEIAVVTDSASALPAEVVEQYGIRVLPLKIIWQGEVLRDGIDMTSQEFYARLEKEKDLPTTSGVSTEEMLETFRTMQAKAIVGIFLANELSSTFSAACAVQSEALRTPFYVVDSRTAAMAQGFVVLEAARAAQAGASVEQVVARAKEISGCVQLLGLLRTLEYLRRGGRIGAAAALLGSALRVNPIVGIPPGAGVVQGVARQRSWRRGVDYMVDLMAKQVGEQPVHLAVSHGGLEEEATDLLDRLGRRFHLCESYLTYFTPVMGAHTGPILVVAWYTGMRVAVPLPNRSARSRQTWQPAVP